MVRTRFDLCGGTTTPAPRASSLLSTVRTGTGSMRQGRSFTASWAIGKCENVCFSSLPTSRTCLVVSKCRVERAGAHCVCAIGGRLTDFSRHAAMSPAEVTEKLGLHRMRDRSWFVHPSCATSGEVSVHAACFFLLMLTCAATPSLLLLSLTSRAFLRDSRGSLPMSRRKHLVREKHWHAERSTACIGSPMDINETQGEVGALSRPLPRLALAPLLFLLLLSPLFCPLSPSCCLSHLLQTALETGADGAGNIPCSPRPRLPCRSAQSGSLRLASVRAKRRPRRHSSLSSTRSFLFPSSPFTISLPPPRLRVPSSTPTAQESEWPLLLDTAAPAKWH